VIVIQYYLGMGHRNIIMFVMVGVLFGFLLGSFGINSSTNDNSLQTESVFAVGHLELVLKDTDGNIKDYVQTDNLIVNEGLNTMADLTFLDINLNTNNTDSKFNVIGIGDFGSPAGFFDAGLGNPICDKISATILGTPASGSSAAIITLNATFFGSDGCVGTIQEAVIANSLTSGEIFTHTAFPPGITLTDNDELDITWDIELGAAVEVGP